jgi:hypothetical protein
MASTGAYPVPGLRAPPPPQTPGLGANMVPTPMGWLSPEQARQMLNHLAPSRQDVASTLGAPMDGMAWAARKLRVKGIPSEYGQPDFAQRAGGRDQLVWQPSADVPLSSQNILRLLNQYVPPGGVF